MVLSAENGSAAGFATTHWSLIAAARDGAAPAAREALAALCTAYWYPVYAHVRRQGFGPEQAQDLTQEFFARLLERDFLEAADPDKGKFRSFLLAACRNFVANQRDHDRALKRGGGRQPLSLDFDAAERRYAREPSHALTPERLFKRRWALTLLDGVLDRLRAEYQGAAKANLFDRLKGFLAGDRPAVRYQQIAAELGMTEGAVKVAVHRLRQRYRELVRDEIARTVETPEQVDDEIRALFVAFGS